MLNGVFSAEFGHGAGVVSVSTKSGSNEFRGTVFDFIRNDVFDAHNYFAQRVRADGSEVPKAPLRRHQFGGAVGGPLNLPGYKGTNRTFFFADYSGLKERRGLRSSTRCRPQHSATATSATSARLPARSSSSTTR